MRNPTGRQLTLAVILVSHAFSSQPVLAQPQPQCSSGKVCTSPECPHVDRTYREGRWLVLETANFQVCCEPSEAPAAQLARHAETLRNVLRAKWLGDVSPEAWNPPCQIVLHAKRQSYVEAVGRAGERTVGSSLVKSDKGRIVARRIDLLEAETDFLSAALPHELTHVVLREKFVSNPLPRWADEGIAILADPKDKQGRHQKDLRIAFSNGTAFHAATLLAMEDYPRPDHFGTFYGQSASLTEFLVGRKSPAQFVDFIERARVEGYDSALQRCYEIASMRELDRQWRQHLDSAASANKGG